MKITNREFSEFFSGTATPEVLRKISRRLEEGTDNEVHRYLAEMRDYAEKALRGDWAGLLSKEEFTYVDAELCAQVVVKVHSPSSTCLALAGDAERAFEVQEPRARSHCVESGQSDHFSKSLGIDQEMLVALQNNQVEAWTKICHEVMPVVAQMIQIRFGVEWSHFGFEEKVWSAQRSIVHSLQHESLGITIRSVQDLKDYLIESARAKCVALLAKIQLDHDSPTGTDSETISTEVKCGFADVAANEIIGKLETLIEELGDEKSTVLFGFFGGSEAGEIRRRLEQETNRKYAPSSTDRLFAASLELTTAIVRSWPSLPHWFSSRIAS
jgi:hypothetical protein